MHPADLFDRTFNGRVAEIEEAVVRGSGVRRAVPPAATACSPARATSSHPATRSSAAASSARWACPRPTSPRSCAGSGSHYRALREDQPVRRRDRPGRALSLLHRVSTLAGASSIAPAELFAVLDALNADPSIRGRNTFDLLIDTPAQEPDCYRILAGGTAADGLWLVQTLVAVVRWMQATDLTGAELHRDPRRGTAAGGRRRGGRPAGRALPAVPGRPADSRGLRVRPVRRRGPPGSSTTSCSRATEPVSARDPAACVRRRDPADADAAVPPPTPASCASR